MEEEKTKNVGPRSQGGSSVQELSSGESTWLDGSASGGKPGNQQFHHVDSAEGWVPQSLFSQS